MALEIAFWVLAVVSVAAAVAVVLLRDIFRAALFLVLCFFTIAGVYVTLNADFLAAVQVLIYVGAIGVLLIFAIMLTRETQRGSPTGRLRVPASIVASLLLGVMIFCLIDADWAPVRGVHEVPLERLAPSGAGITGNLAQALFDQGGFILPFEIAAVLLLAAIIGAIVMARER